MLSHMLWVGDNNDDHCGEEDDNHEGEEKTIKTKTFH